MDKNIILAYGWKHLGGFYYYWPFDTYLEEFSGRRISWRLNWVDTSRTIKMEAYERNSFDWIPVLEAPCPDIETFQMLMKLFKIEPTEDKAPEDREEIMELYGK